MRIILTTSLLAGFSLPVAAAKLNGTGTANSDRFGTSAALVGSSALVGAPDHNQGGVADRGAAFLYRNPASLAGTQTQNARLTASDGAAGDQFGASVSLDANNALVGAPGDDSSASITDRGSAYLFREVWNATGTVTQAVKLEATSAAAGDRLGASVALDGALGIAGNPGINFFGTNDRGAVYLFKNLDTATGTINEGSILYDSGGALNDRLGTAVALWQGTAAAGAPDDDVGSNADQGSVCYFRNLATAGAVLTEAVKLTASDGAANDGFGAAVGMSGDAGTGMRHVVAGAPGDDTASTSQSGSAYLFRINTTVTGSMTQHAKLTVSGAASDDNFGSSVGVSGTTAIVGAPGLDKPGFACIFLNLNSLSGTVNEALRVWASDGAIGDGFGSSVAIDNGMFVVGARSGSGNVAGSGTAWTGSVGLLTTANAGGTIEMLRFRSRTDWNIGDTADGTVVKLAANAFAEFPIAGTAVRVGRAATADNNRLVVDGTITQVPGVVVGDSVNTGNELRVNGSVTAAAVTVNRDSIVSGDGLIEGAVTVTGSVRPGDGNRDTLDVAGDVTWNAGNAWQFDLAAGNLSDRLAISGTGSDFLKGTGSAARTFDFLGSSQAGTYTLVTWSGTTNFAASDFTATNIGGGLAAVFSIVGKSLTVTIGSSLTPIEQWRQTHFGSSANSGNGADTFDFDKDGVPNLVEYALGTAPTSPASSARPLPGLSSNRLTLQFTPQVVSGLTYSIQTSTNLGAWTTTNLAGLTAGKPFTWTDSVTTTSGPRRFVRLAVSY
jgi:hypothetical protein